MRIIYTYRSSSIYISIIQCDLRLRAGSPIRPASSVSPAPSRVRIATYGVHAAAEAQQKAFAWSELLHCAMQRPGYEV